MNFDAELLDDVSRAAEISALRFIRAKLEKSDNLEKLEQLNASAARHNRILDDELRVVFRLPLSIIRKGITQFQITLDNWLIGEENRTEDAYLDPDTYRQLSVAQTNLDYLIKVPANIKKASELLERQRFLQAQQVITEIENSRNYLLFELHQIKARNSQSIVNAYFAKCEKLVEDLRQMISYRMSRWYDCTVNAPDELVTALRIVAQEELIDRFWSEKKASTGFSPPDRPRQWEKYCFDLLRKSVKNRIEGNQLETREEHKQWLTRHLEMCRKRFLNDFQIITKNCVRIFPKHYNIVNRFLLFYHHGLQEYLTEVCDPQQSIEITEIYAVFDFIRDYYGKECLNNPELNLDISQLPPLLGKETLVVIIDVFVNERKEKMTEWIRKIVSLEVKDWKMKKEVESTPEHHFMTTLPRMLMNMITETLDMAKQMSDEACSSIVSMISAKLNEFRELYIKEIDVYTRRYFDNRDEFQANFTKQMIANANNCESIPNFLLLIREKYDQSITLERYESIRKNFENTAEYCCEIIVQEMEMDAVEFLKALFTREWFGLTVNPYCRRILEITQSYYSEKLKHLKKPLLAYLFHTWHKRILAYYLRNIFSRTVTVKLKTELDRRTCAEQLRREAAMLEREFILWDGTSAENATRYDFNMLNNIAGILEQTDLDYIAFDIGTLAKRYPSLTNEQIQLILLLRRDFTKQQAKDKAETALATMPRANHGILVDIMGIVNQLNQKSLK